MSVSKFLDWDDGVGSLPILTTGGIIPWAGVEHKPWSYSVLTVGTV